jgi:hypothetical protein
MRESMIKHNFSPLPYEAFESFGGFTWVRSEIWQKYLNEALRTFSIEEASLDSGSWLENSCIFLSLRDYLFSQYGVLVPEESLFQIYNRDGEGILPSCIIDALMSVLKPLGFDVDKVLVPDDELRLGMGHKELVLDISAADQFDKQAGVCMINIHEGYSHAFYWKEMDRNKFFKDQFRLAVMVNRLQGSPVTPNSDPHLPSATSCLIEFCRYLEKRLLDLNTALKDMEGHLGNLLTSVDTLSHSSACDTLDQVMHNFSLFLDYFKAKLLSLPGTIFSVEAGSLLETGMKVQFVINKCLTEGVFIK